MNCCPMPWLAEVRKRAQQAEADTGRKAESRHDDRHTSELDLNLFKRFNDLNFQNFGPKERQMIKESSLKSLQEEVERLLDSSCSAQENHAAYRGALKKLGNKTAAFAEDFSMYLKAYGGILEILRQGDNMMYGGAAYQALSMLLIVGVNKRRKETQINETLLRLQREYSRIKELQTIHSNAAVDNPKLDEYVKEAVLLGIAFMQRAIQYYQQSSWRRVLQALTRPPDIELDKLVGGITEAITEIFNECNMLDSKRLAAIEQLSEENKTKVQALTECVSNQDSRSRNEKLGKYRAVLGARQKTKSLELDTYQGKLDEAFHNLRRWAPFQFVHLQEADQYHSWINSRQSSFLLLCGKTKKHNGDCCRWSPALKAIYGQISQNEEIGIGTYLCQPERWSNGEVSAVQVLQDLIYQLLENPGFPLLDPEESRSLEEAITQAGSGGNTESYLHLLDHVIHRRQQVFLLVDRSDRIQGRKWMEDLAKHLKRADCITKVLLIGSTEQYDSMNQQKLSSSVIEDLRQILQAQLYVIEKDD